ncbi:NUDIX hydrolase [Erysipelothrix larvae]|uniref:NUDIX hydrolase n=1 Tax=Erysipelothrix larvae TaxID=1514105 RepID=UPI001E6142F3|nr:NUDIX hydrolase [Erysipelothrix larvae]
MNLIIVFSKDKQRVLMCKRRKNPYKGLLNFVGGKAFEQEDGLEAAYRELEEETGLTPANLTIQCLFITQYMDDGVELQVYYGFLNTDVEVVAEVNPLLWVSTSESFDNENKYAGNGNIQHMMTILKEKYGLQ